MLHSSICSPDSAVPLYAVLSPDSPLQKESIQNKTPYVVQLPRDNSCVYICASVHVHNVGNMVTFRLCLDQGFSEGKGKGNGNGYEKGS